MKNTLFRLTLEMLILYSSAIYAGNLFYYGGEEKIPISYVHNKRALLRQSVIAADDYVERIGARIEIVNSEVNWNNDPRIIYENVDGRLSLPIVSLDNGFEMVLVPEIIVKPKMPSYDMSLLCEKYHLLLEEDIKRFQVYSIPIDEDVISIANELYETGLFDYAYPNFFCSDEPNMYIPNDTYFPYQIALHNTGQTLPNGHSGTIDADINAPEAWDITKGSPDIIVAVLDEGVTSNHPDLPNSRQIRLNGSNFGTGNPNDPSPTGNDNHGNACAGVIAATMDNNQGIAGIAPNCKIMPIRKDGTTDATDIATAIYFAVDNGADIISNSWNYRYQNPNVFPVIRAAIDTALHHNIVVVFSVGNYADHVIGNNGYVAYPACLNVFLPNLIAVGASDRYDQMAQYSPKSSTLDFVAPSHRAYSSQIPGESLEMWTLDIPGQIGYNPIPQHFVDSLYYSVGTEIPSSGTNYLAYTGCFGGTSYSCPVVAGITALMLSVNPYLTPADVDEILKNSCDKVGGYTYTNGKCSEMGYGRVNAYAAVYNAKYKYIVGPDYLCDTVYYSLNDVPTGATCTWSITMPSDLTGSYSIIQGQGTSSICAVRTIPASANLMDNSSESSQSGTRVPSTITDGSVDVTVTTGNDSFTASKTVRSPVGDKPIVSVSNNNAGWLVNTTRRFTVINCTNEPDSVFSWVVKRDNVIVYTGSGKLFFYTPSSTGLYTISVTNTEKECGNNTTTLQYLVVYSNFSNDDVEDGAAILDEHGIQCLPIRSSGGNYTLELWHIIYGRLRVQHLINTEEPIDTEGLPEGVYILLLKEGNEIILQKKVSIR